MVDPELESLKQDYDRDGFVILRDYLETDEVQALREHAIPLATRLLTGSDPDQRFRNLAKSLNRFDPWFEQQMNQGRHLPMICHLLGGEARGASAAWFDRPEGEDEGVNPHVDALGKNPAPDAGITIWFALDPTDKANGCLHYLKGSHRKSYPGEIWVDNIDTASPDVVAVELNPGDVAIHSALTVHWSGGNQSGKPRRAVSYFYFGERAYQAYIHNRELRKRR